MAPTTNNGKPSKPTADAILGYVIKVIWVLMTVIAWFLNDNMKSISTTLIDIKSNVGSLTRDSLLLQQKVDFQLQWVKAEAGRLRIEIRDLRKEMDTHLERHHGSRN